MFVRQPAIENSHSTATMTASAATVQIKKSYQNYNRQNLKKKKVYDTFEIKNKLKKSFIILIVLLVILKRKKMSLEMV